MDFKADVLDVKGIVLVDFWATWCGPCQMLAPVLEEITKANPDVKIVKVDVDVETDLANQYNVSSIPMVIVFDHGQVKDTIIGFHQKSDYLKAIGK